MLLIFDWDGTLIDSSEKIVTCLREAGKSAGLPELSDKKLTSIIGLGRQELIDALYPEDEFPESDKKTKEKFWEYYVKYYVEADQIPCDFFPGVMDTLEGFKSEGYDLAVATGKSRKGLDRVIKNTELENFFHSSRCADETRSKPHPLMLEELLQEFSKHPEEALMVGDTIFDMKMAQQANMPRIAVSYGAHSIEDLQGFEPQVIIDSFKELKGYV